MSNTVPGSHGAHTGHGAAHQLADPCDFTDEELAGYWAEELAGYWADVRTAARAIEQAYQPCQLNYATFNNAVPHVHTHIIPRYPDDPAPGRPLPDWVFAGATALDPAELAHQVQELRRRLPGGGATAGGQPETYRTQLPGRS
jgi:hypothetical protein